MKKREYIIIIIQVVVLILIINSLFLHYKMLRFTYIDKTDVSISFVSGDSIVSFIDWLNQEDLAAVKTFNRSDKEMDIYLSNLTYSSDIRMINGRIPANEEYLSDIKHNDPKQCGLIRPLLPNYSVRIYELKECISIDVYEMYTINTDDENILRRMQSELSKKGVSINLSSDQIRVSNLVALISTYSKYQIILTMLFFLSVILTFISIIAIEHDYKAKRKAVKTGLVYKCAIMISIFMLTTTFMCTLSYLPTVYNEYKTAAYNNKQFQPLKNIYRLGINDIGEASSLEFEVELYEPALKLYNYLSENNTAFFADADYLKAIEYYNADVPLNGLVNDGYRTHITVGANYFKRNPINTIKGNSVLDEIVLSDNTLNVIVPEKYTALSDELEQYFLELFDFRKNQIYNNVYQDIDPENSYNASSDPLKVNMIYTKNDQSYFLFSPIICKNSGNSITDPVVVVFTNNVHPSSMLSKMTRCFYFEYNDEKSINDYLYGITETQNFVYPISISNEALESLNVNRYNFIYCICILLTLALNYSSVSSVLKENINYHTCEDGSIRNSIAGGVILFILSLISMIVYNLIIYRVLRRFTMRLSVEMFILMVIIIMLYSIIPARRHSSNS